jgi:hypothetical protein
MMFRSGRRGVLGLPELQVAIFAFLLGFAWEILQGPFFQGMTEARHGEAVRLCTLATLGDVAIMLVNFWAVAVVSGGRRWVLHPTTAQVADFAGLGLASAVLIEILATRVWHLWRYRDVMPTIPVLEVGLVPLLMWSALPPLVVWFVNRQLTGGAGGMATQVGMAAGAKPHAPHDARYGRGSHALRRSGMGHGVVLSRPDKNRGEHDGTTTG